MGGRALKAELQTPVDLAFDPDGNLYVAERFGYRILMVDTKDTLTVVAGGDEPGFSGDGGPAAKAKLNGASAVAVNADGNLYIADTYNHRIRKVDENGVITTIAGNGRPGFSGDRGPAVRAALNEPGGMVFDAEGNLYVVDRLNYRVRKIDWRGTITTVAGNGESGFAPDGTLATRSRLGDAYDHCPMGLAFNAEGRLHLIELENDLVRRIDDEGRLRSVAGGGERLGDGGKATEALVEQPLDIAFDDEGNLYIATHDHGEGRAQRIRRVDEDGIITTLAGTGTTDFFGDGGRATAAKFNIPSAVAVGPDGNVYVADADNNVIRMITR